MFRAFLTSTLLTVGLAHAAGPAEVKADDVTLDARGRTLEAHGNVRVDANPFFLTADHLKLERSWRGLEVTGPGWLSFCPCSGPPFSLRFESGAVAPPADLFVKSPTLLLYGLPVFWLPYFWLRAPTRLGLLPPSFAWRGVDGLFTGGGVHIPFARGLDVTGGGYWRGGFAGSLNVRTERSVLDIRLDTLRGDTGVTLDGRGSFDLEHGAWGVWDTDARIGARALYATTDLGEAAKPVNRFAAGVIDGGARHHVSAALSALGVRSTKDEAALHTWSPNVGAAATWALGERTTASVWSDAATFRADGALANMARARVLLDSAQTLGPVALESHLRASVGAGPSSPFGAARSAVGVSVPLARSFGETRHILEPVLRGVAVTRVGTEPLAYGTEFGARALPPGSAALAVTGVRSALGHAGWAWTVDGHAGVGAFSRGARGLVHFESALRSAWFALYTEAAGMMQGDESAFYAVGRARLGTAHGASLSLHAAGRTRRDPMLARVLAEDEAALPMMFQPGWSGGARTSVPIARWLRLYGGAEVDLTARVRLGTHGGVEVRDTCDCVAFRATVSERLGRDGVDGWLEIDLRPR